MGSRKYLVIFHAVSAGQNGDDLGCDEQEIVLLVYLILDIANNKVVSVHQFPVKPEGADINQNILSEEVEGEYGISEHDLKLAASLGSVLGQFDSVIREQLSQGAATFTLVTDGPLHIRQLLFPETFRKNITLPAYYQRFHDIRKEFQAAFPGSSSKESLSIEDMISTLGLTTNTAPDLAIRTVNNMARVLQKFISDSRQLHEPEVVQLALTQGIRTKNEQVDGQSVVRARGLPWQASDTDIARFFIGLNVAPGGVALCLSAQGRRNGEALVLFEFPAHRDMALRRHKHHIGNRYIEVYKATGEDFIDVAGGNNTEAQEFLGRGGQVIIRMRGLPYDCSAKQVIEFFNNGKDPCDVLDEEHGVLFVKKPDGRATGDAFVLFKEEGDGEKALQKHKEIIGSRYIELFRSTTAEVQQVLNRSTEPLMKGNSSTPLLPSNNPPLLPALPNIPPMAIIPQQLITAGTRKDCIRLRGLPYEAQVENILEFLGDHAKNIVYQGVHMVFNSQGQPSGEAFIQMDSEGSAHTAATNRHHRYMIFGKKQRYIEVFQCSGEDMSLVLTGGLLQPASSSGGVAKSSLLSPGMSTTSHAPSFPLANVVMPPTSVVQHPPQLQLLPEQLQLLTQPPPTAQLSQFFPQGGGGMLQLGGLLPPPPQAVVSTASLLPAGWELFLPPPPPGQQTAAHAPFLMMPGVPPPPRPALATSLLSPYFAASPAALAAAAAAAQQQQQQSFFLPTTPQLTRLPAAPPAAHVGVPAFPQAGSGPGSVPPPTTVAASVKRSHDQAFQSHYPDTNALPPKRPPVMYTEAGAIRGSGAGSLLPTPPQTFPQLQ